MDQFVKTMISENSIGIHLNTWEVLQILYIRHWLYHDGNETIVRGLLDHMVLVSSNGIHPLIIQGNQQQKVISRIAATCLLSLSSTYSSSLGWALPKLRIVPHRMCGEASPSLKALFVPDKALGKPQGYPLLVRKGTRYYISKKKI